MLKQYIYMVFVQQIRTRDIPTLDTSSQDGFYAILFPEPVEFHIYEVVLRVESIVSRGSVVDFLVSLG